MNYDNYSINTQTRGKVPGDDIPQTIKEAYALHGETAGSAQDLADIAGVDVRTVQEILSDPDKAYALEAYRLKAEREGKLRPPRVGRVLDKAIDAIEKQLDAGVDGFEAADLAKPLIRILENSERVRLAEREKDANASLPVFNFVFHNGGGFTAHAVKDHIPVIDVTAGAADSKGGV